MRARISNHWRLVTATMGILFLVLAIGGLRMITVAQETGEPDWSPIVADPQGDQPIVGSWRIWEPGQKAAMDRLHQLVTFQSDGTLIVTDPVMGTAHGSWRIRDDGSAEFRYEFLQADPEGRFSERIVYRGTATVGADGASWVTSTLEATHFNPAGNAFQIDALAQSAENRQVEAAPAGDMR